MENGRYKIFIGSIYYPAGGMLDFFGESDILSDAISMINDEIQTEFGETMEQKWQYKWAHIWDSELKGIVWEQIG